MAQAPKEILIGINPVQKDVESLTNPEKLFQKGIISNDINIKKEKLNISIGNSCADAHLIISDKKQAVFLKVTINNFDFLDDIEPPVKKQKKCSKSLKRLHKNLSVKSKEHEKELEINPQNISDVNALLSNREGPINKITINQLDFAYPDEIDVIKDIFKKLGDQVKSVKLNEVNIYRFQSFKECFTFFTKLEQIDFAKCSTSNIGENRFVHISTLSKINFEESSANLLQMFNHHESIKKVIFIESDPKNLFWVDKLAELKATLINLVEDSEEEEEEEDINN